MKRTLRVGTRGSDLARVQTRLVCAALQQRIADLEIEEVIIRTHGDEHASQSVMDAQWPMGGFTSAIERALLAGEIDFAVHSLKDLPVAPTKGTLIAAIPAREAAHDVLLTAEPTSLENIPAGLRIGTSSPRRAAQLRRLGDVKTIELRGNIPARLARIGGDLDGVILAAAGLRRLGITHPNAIDLPIATFLPAPGQGALAVQARADDVELARELAILDEPKVRAAVDAERSLLGFLGGGCAAPVGAHATAIEGMIRLRGQVFSAEGRFEAIGEEHGAEPVAVAQLLASRLKKQLGETLS